MIVKLRNNQRLRFVALFVIVVGITLFLFLGRVEGAINSVPLPPQIHTFKTVHGGSHLRFLEHRYEAERYATSTDNVDVTCAKLRPWFKAQHKLVSDEGPPKTVGKSRRCSYRISHRGVRIVVSVFSESPLTDTVPSAPSYVYLYNAS